MDEAVADLHAAADAATARRRNREAVLGLLASDTARQLAQVPEALHPVTCADVVAGGAASPSDLVAFVERLRDMAATHARRLAEASGGLTISELDAARARATSICVYADVVLEEVRRG